jgi:hypothetical protein
MVQSPPDRNFIWPQDQQTHDLTHEEAVDQLCFNIQWHYALNITKESESAKYMFPKTLWNMRTIVAENGLEKSCSTLAHTS